MRIRADQIFKILRNVIEENPSNTSKEKCDILIKEIKENFPNKTHNEISSACKQIFEEALITERVFKKGELILLCQLILNLEDNLVARAFFTNSEKIFKKIYNDDDIEEMKSFFTLIDQELIKFPMHALKYSIPNVLVFMSKFLYHNDSILSNNVVNLLFNSLRSEQSKSLIKNYHYGPYSIFEIFSSSNTALIDRAFYEICGEEKLLNEACKVHSYLIDFKANPPKECKIKAKNEVVKALLPLALTAKDPLGQIFNIRLPNEILKIIVGHIIPQVNILNYNTFNYLANVMLGSNRDIGKLSELFNLAIKDDNIKNSSKKLLNNMHPQNLEETIPSDAQIER